MGAERDQLLPPARHQFIESGCSRRHEQVKAAALRHAAARRRRAGRQIRGIAEALENRDPLKAISDGMCGEQAADSPANDHSMTMCRNCHAE